MATGGGGAEGPAVQPARGAARRRHPPRLKGAPCSGRSTQCGPPGCAAAGVTWRTRSSSTPCANWHLCPYGHEPAREKVAHSSVCTHEGTHADQSGDFRRREAGAAADAGAGLCGAELRRALYRAGSLIRGACVSAFLPPRAMVALEERGQSGRCRDWRCHNKKRASRLDLPVPFAAFSPTSLISLGWVALVIGSTGLTMPSLGRMGAVIFELVQSKVAGSKKIVTATNQTEDRPATTKPDRQAHKAGSEAGSEAGP